MTTTPVSLLERLRGPGHPDAWARFVFLYTPLLYRWARRAGASDADAADLVQDVFVLLLDKLPEFAYDRHRSFRAWLRTLALNRWRDNWRKRRELLGAPGLDGLASPDPLEELWEAEYRGHLAGRALDLMRSEFEPATWQACWQTVVEGRSAAEVAATLGLSENAVYLARSRVLRRLRQELDGLF